MKKTAPLLFATMALAMLLASGVAWAAAGELDSTFGGGDGKVVNKRDGTIADVEVLPNGKIVTFNGHLVRYNADGPLDRSFGDGDGKVFATDFAITPPTRAGGTCSSSRTARSWWPATAAQRTGISPKR